MVDFMGSSNDILNGTNTLGRSRMRQHHFSIGITNAVDVGNDLAALLLGQDLHLFIDSNKAALSLDTALFQTHLGSVGDAARGDHAGVDFESLDVFPVRVVISRNGLE